jgi:hypothetical protein
MNLPISKLPKLVSPGESVPQATTSRVLPSGRSVIVKVGDQHEEMEVRSPSGEVEVHIVLTENGPVVRLRGARLELESPETVAVSCKRFEVQTSEKTELHSAGEVQVTGQEMRVKTEGDIHLNGDYIRLNC